MSVFYFLKDIFWGAGGGGGGRGGNCIFIIVTSFLSY